MSSFILQTYFVSGAQPKWWQWLQYSIMTIKANRAKGLWTLCKGWAGAFRNRDASSAHFFHLHTRNSLDTAMKLTYVLQPTCIHHEKTNASESLLLLTACDIVSTTSPPHRPHPSEDGWRTPAHLLKQLSFTPSWAFSISPQQQSLQETSGEITGPLWEHAWPSRSFLTATSVTKERWCKKDSLRQAESTIRY